MLILIKYDLDIIDAYNRLLNYIFTNVRNNYYATFSTEEFKGKVFHGVFMERLVQNGLDERFGHLANYYLICFVKRQFITPHITPHIAIQDTGEEEIYGYRFREL